MLIDASQVERQLYLLRLISESKEGYTVNDLHEQLSKVGIDVSKKTVRRDIDFISTGSFFVYEEKRDNKVYYMAKKYGVENITLTGSELVSLHFIKELLKSYTRLDIGYKTMELVDKVIKRLPKIDKAYIDFLDEMIKVKESYIGVEKEINKDIIYAVRKAIKLNKRVKLKYHSFNRDETTERLFDPYLIEIYEGCYHLIGYCHLRNSIRDLRVSRIKSAELLRNTFERPEGFYEQYKKDRFRKLVGEDQIKLVLKFTKEAARYIKEYESNKADRLIEHKSGDLIFEKTTTMTPEIVKWVLGFGKYVIVIEPEVVRRAVIEHAEGILEGYKGIGEGELL